MLMAVLVLLALSLTCVMFGTRERMLGYPSGIFWAIMGGHSFTESIVTWDIYYFLFFASMGMAIFSFLAMYALREKRDTIGDEEMERGEGGYIDEDREESRTFDEESMETEWVGVDLDGTLAKWEKWCSPDEVGKPINAMVRRIKKLRLLGYRVKILTARATPPCDPGTINAIQDWCESVFGERFEVTHAKDYDLKWFYDDRAVEIVNNTGELATQKAFKHGARAMREIAIGKTCCGDTVSYLLDLDLTKLEGYPKGPAGV